jgi:hypothetical protein
VARRYGAAGPFRAGSDHGLTGLGSSIPESPRLFAAETVVSAPGGVAVGSGQVFIGGAARPVSWPCWLGVVPPQVECFQHRAAADALAAAAADEGANDVQCLVLTGPGGIGKTQLAASYARAAWDAQAVDLLLWVNADSRAGILSAYAEAAAEVLGTTTADPERAAGRMLTWLEATQRRWLVVLDDLADPADLRGLWPPANPDGRAVVTTRRREAALGREGRRIVDVGLFTAGEAAAYVSAKLAARHRADEAAEIDALAADLGYLPVALAQAVAYITDRVQLDCAGYRALLADRRHRLGELVPDESGLPDDQRKTVAGTWSLSIEQADSLRPAGLARPMLELASMLDANGVPEIVLSTPPALAYLREHASARNSTTPREVGVRDAADALVCLHRLSLVELDQASSRHRIVRIHNLVQRATQENVAADRRDPLVFAAADALAAAWPDVERDTGLAQMLRANAAVLTGQAREALWARGAHPLLFRAARSLAQAGLLAPAVTWLQGLLAVALVRLGPDHPDTLVIRGDLADLRGEAGDAAGAAAAYEELLADCLRVLGSDDRNTLATRGNLTRWRAEAGDAAGAVAAAEQLVADFVRALGPDHRDTLTARAYLSRWRAEAGYAAGAVAATEELLADCLRVLGPDHPDTLAARDQLTAWRRVGGDTGAAAAFEELLADRLRVLGPDHPDTLTTRSELAYLRWEAGDAAGAAAAAEELLADRLRVLGPDHSHTLATRSDLAWLRGEAGDAAGAAAATEDLLADRLRVLGPDNSDTLATRSRLAFWRGEAGDMAGAAAATRELLADYLRVLGPDHPYTLTTRGNLALLRGQAGDAAGAAAAYEELLADRLRVLGPDHPDTVATRSNLARWRQQADARS